VEFLQIETRPELNAPIAVCAFAGWNDAASAATNAARFVVRRLGARKFARIDPEEFYDFRETRPSVRITARGEREVNWPTNEFFYARNPTGPHDVVVFIGTEPSLRWRSFTEAHAGLFSDLGVDMVVSLGALLADVPHSRDVRVTGTAMTPAASERLGLQASRYEGPTGIVGVMHTALRDAKLSGASLWANVPHYITTSQNPPATAALLKRLSSILNLEFDLSELESAGERFMLEVNTALAANPEVQEYVQRLEEAFDSGFEDDQPPATPLPKGEDLVMDVEDFLRSQREGDDD
jgi:proteasome assembly chaperone (PAC2) family protein